VYLETVFKNQVIMKKVSNRIWYAFAYSLIWLKTFILWVLAFGVLGAIIFELVKGKSGLIIATLFLIVGVFMGIRNANLARKIGWIHYDSRLMATPEMDDPNFFEKQKEKLET
jgi:hypothetical protein